VKYEYGDTEYEGDDFYCYPDTKVLMNRFDIREQENLTKIERLAYYIGEVNVLHLFRKGNGRTQRRLFQHFAL
jgi:cell filamentation protein